MQIYKTKAMILSYESLLKEWIQKGNAEKIINIQRNKAKHMDYFLSRDSHKLLGMVKDGDTTTLIALLRCFNKETIESLRVYDASDDQRAILYDIESPEALADSFLRPELEKTLKDEKGLII